MIDSYSAMVAHRAACRAFAFSFAIATAYDYDYVDIYDYNMMCRAGGLRGWQW